MPSLPTLQQAAGNVATAGASVIASARAALTSAGAAAGAVIASAGATAGTALASAATAAGTVLAAAGETTASAATAAASMAGRTAIAGVSAVNTVIGPERLVGAAMAYQGARMINRAAYHDEPINDVLAAALFAGGGMMMIARDLIAAELAQGQARAAAARGPVRVAPAAPAPRSPAVLEAVGEAMNMLSGLHDSVDLSNLPLQDAVRIGDHFMDYVARTTASPRVDHAIESAGLDPQRIVANLHALVTAQPPVLSNRASSAAGRD